MKNKKLCYLCEQESDLVKSHLIPKFVFKKMISEGGLLRSATTPNFRMQDGLKKELLCDNCELLFSQRERVFSETIFKQVLDQGKGSFVYDSNFYYFAVSILWRVLVHHLDNRSNKKFDELLNGANQEWKKYLLNPEDGLADFGEIHLLISDVVESSEDVPQLNRYLIHASDGTIVSGSEDCLVYVKFFQFLLFAWITPRDISVWENTKIELGGGEFCGEQKVEQCISDFVISRARQVSESFKNLNEKQQSKIDDFIEMNSNRIVNSNLGKAISADFSTNKKR
ncbi:hypothetical protein [Candidatus Uabimicrobium sp. HlEnr_7]|uniref:hypothetical protein n=1 Tax=Candidatus Uabimicrobium helgolandensis TaxID=3095367 RepID=UPI0035577980